MTGTLFCVDDNFGDQPAPRRAGLALQRPAVLEPYLTGDPVEDVLITTADPRALVPSGASVLRPRDCERLDVGVTLGAVIGAGGPTIAAYVPVLDFLRLDVPPTQTYLARSFPTHKVVGTPVPAAKVDPERGLRMRLRIDGALQQDSSTADMIAPPARLVAVIADRCALGPGDLILTGSPGGRPADAAGPWVRTGAVVVGEIDGVGTVSASVISEPRG